MKATYGADIYTAELEEMFDGPAPESDYSLFEEEDIYTEDDLDAQFAMRMTLDR